MDKSKWAKMSGEDNIKSAPKYIVPTIRLNGKEGSFIKAFVNEKGEFEKRELGFQLEGVFLKIRRSYFSFSKTNRLFTNEHNSFKDHITLFEAKELKTGWKTSMIDSGDCKTIREKFPELKMMQSIYFLFGGEVVKLQVKGKGLGNLFNYWQEFGADEHTFEVMTSLNSVKESNSLGTFFAMTFEKARVLDDEEMELVGKKIEEVSETIEKIENFYSSYKPTQEATGDIEIKDEEIPVINVEEEGSIDVKDIPF